jgi:hypothetical protein
MTRFDVITLLLAIAIAAALAVYLSGCCATQSGLWCLSAHLGTQQCIDSSDGVCTWTTCDRDACLIQDEWECSWRDNKSWWHKTDPAGLPPVTGRMKRGCLWGWRNCEGGGNWRETCEAYFDPKTCEPVEE